MQEATTSARESFTFGPYRLNVPERLLERDGTPVVLGSRALDILITLVESAGTVISKGDLMARVWRDVTIEEVGLRVHIANLRKALGDGKDNARYIINVAGRGYCFVAPLTQSSPNLSSNLSRSIIDPERRLPPLPIGMIGREEVVRNVSQEVLSCRFLTITGHGGVGKTTVAVAVAYALSEEFFGNVYFVDLASVIDPALVPGTILSALGGAIQFGDPLPGLLAFLRDKRALLLLDNCEHVIEAAASAAERIFQEADETCIVATSREPLRVAGERVHRLSPLASPPSEVRLTAADALAFPAVRLFVEHASAVDNSFELSDTDAPVAALICRMLDGIALAIELAASQVGTYGVQGLADLIDHRLGLLTQGRRTAPPRHQTLQALLDWSYNLLPPFEQEMLCRLSCFSARFTLNAAKAVVSEREGSLAPISTGLSNLVSKSLVAREAVGKGIRYRLLDTTREYASAKLHANDAPNVVAKRHALYFAELLETENTAAHSDEERWLVFSEYLGDVRTALEWGFSEHGDVSVAKVLAQKAAPLFLELSLLAECTRWAEQALALLGDKDRGTRSEMEIQAALAVSLMFTKGNSEEVKLAFEKALVLAERLDDARYELRLNGGLYMFSLRTGDFNGSLRFAQRCARIAEKTSDGVSTDIAHALLSVSYHLMGDQLAAQRHCEAALNAPALHHRRHAIHFGFDLVNRARIAYARLLWQRGFPNQAVVAANSTIREAAELEHPVTLCIALIWTLPVFFWVGNLNAAKENIEWFIQHHERHQLAAYHGIGIGLKGEMAIRLGEIDRGVKLLRQGLAVLRQNHYGLITTVFASALAEGLAMSDRAHEALALIDHQIAQVKMHGDLFYMPDLLRIKGDVQISDPAHHGRAEATLLESLKWAREQQALSWELRSATSLAQLYSRTKPDQAKAILRPIFDRFTEGLETPDLVRAARLLKIVN
jgi:predicted ATPase/DNA-binding winged helix-turn-helix (wHTH) protein